MRVFFDFLRPAFGHGRIYLLVMPKYWVTNYFAHGSFPEVGQKQKTEKKKKREKRKRRANDGNNNDQATHGSTHGAAWTYPSPWSFTFTFIISIMIVGEFQ